MAGQTREGGQPEFTVRSHEEELSGKNLPFKTEK